MTKKNIIALIISIIVIFVGAIVTWQTSDSEVFCIGLLLSFLGVAVALMVSDGKES